MECELPLSLFDSFVPRGKVVVAKGRDMPYVAGTSAPDGSYAKSLVEFMQCAAFGAFGAFGSDIRLEIYKQNLLASSTGAPLVRY